MQPPPILDYNARALAIFFTLSPFHPFTLKRSYFFIFYPRKNEMRGTFIAKKT